MRWAGAYIALRVVRETDLILTIAESLARIGAKEGLVVLDPPINVPSVEVHMGWHERNHTDTAQRWIRAEIVVLAESLKLHHPVQV